MNARRIVIVGCSGAKQEHAAPAVELYTSVLFRKSVAYARSLGGPDWILSAKHHLVPPTFVLSPYDVELDTVAARRAWGHVVALSLLTNSAEGDELVVLAGESYIRPWRETLSARSRIITAPLDGLAIGDRLHWLKANLVERRVGGAA